MGPRKPTNENPRMSRTQDQIDHQVAARFAGIDVSKDKLDFAIHNADVFLTAPNDRRGIQRLIRQCIIHNVALVVLEPTEKFHRLVQERLHEVEIAVAAVNPFRSRKFADSLGQLAKTDKIDAQVLARYAAVIRPAPSQPVAECSHNLKELQAARRQLVDEIGDLKRKLKASVHGLAIRQIKARLKLAEAQKAVVDDAMQELITSEPDLKSKFQILMSIPNIGATTATLLLADLSELGRVNCRQIPALVGVASSCSHRLRLICMPPLTMFWQRFPFALSAPHRGVPSVCTHWRYSSLVTPFFSAKKPSGSSQKSLSSSAKRAMLTPPPGAATCPTNSIGAFAKRSTVIDSTARPSLGVEYLLLGTRDFMVK